MRTWAPRGQTPVLQYHFNWKVLSAMAGITGWNLYFRLYPDNHPRPPGGELPRRTFRHFLPWKLLVVRTDCQAHRRALGNQEFIRAQRGRLALEWLPGYAAELNPVEYIRVYYWKHHELPNFCPQNFGQLSHYARKALRRMRKRPSLVIAFWRQAELFPL